MIFIHDSASSRRFSVHTALQLLIIITAICFLAIPSAAVDQPLAAPDVGIIILSGALPSDVISFTYNGVVDESAARADLETLLQATGWKVEEVRITVGEGQPQMTSVEFQVDSAVPWNTGVLLVEPFLVTFKRFDLVQINYLLQGSIKFRSLRNFSNKYVDITWTAKDSSYTYTATIKDHDFDRLDLPLVVEPPKAQSRESIDDRRAGDGRKTWIALILALVAGVVVFAIVSRIGQQRKEH